MAGHQPWKNPNDFLYHYTTTAGLIGIITSGKMWLTNAGFLNDSQELTYGAQKAASQLRIRADAARSSAGDHEMNKYVAGALEDIANSIECINAPGNGRFEFPYVASFSEERDDLSQWRGYASGGYCVAFHRESLGAHLVPVGEDVVLGIGQNIPFLEKIHYGDEADLHLQEQVSTIVPALYEGGYPAAPSGVNTYYMVKNALIPALALTKHPAFQAEREWRICLVDVGSIKFRDSSKGPVSYSEVKFAPNAVAEIIASPGDNSDRRVRAAEELLFQHGYHSVPVTSSTAPYVG